MVKTNIVIVDRENLLIPQQLVLTYRNSFYITNKIYIYIYFVCFLY